MPGGAMKPYSLDDNWELLKLRYEEMARPIPLPWVAFYRAVRAILRWGGR